MNKGRRAGIAVVAVVAVVAVGLAGCASRPVNEHISAIDPVGGYRPSVLVPGRDNNDPETFFVLSFSGGGTRAAALSFGVLEELRRTGISADGKPRRLIDEVDIIAGVSGGSFTALSYALYGDRLFDEYERRFLKRDVQGALIWRTLNPLNWGKLMSRNYGRSELAAEYYDEILFGNATFSDLIEKRGPVAIANSTDMSLGTRFGFYQNDFDLICSDLGPVRLSRAAASSSAVPVVLSPVTFNNYGGTCGYQYPPWVKDLLVIDEHKRPAGRALERYHDMAALGDGENRPYLHLIDGGVSDNIGVRGVLDALEVALLSHDFANQSGLLRIRRLVIIIVNAHSEDVNDWGQEESPPGMVDQLMKSSGVPIERYSFETVELMKDRAAVATWRRELAVAQARLAGMGEEEAQASIPRIDVFVMEVSFDRISDPVRRGQFRELPTSFALPDMQVDRLRQVAGELMRQSPDYQAILKSFGGTREEPPGVHQH